MVTTTQPGRLAQANLRNLSMQPKRVRKKRNQNPETKSPLIEGTFSSRTWLMRFSSSDPVTVPSGFPGEDSTANCESSKVYAQNGFMWSCRSTVHQGCQNEGVYSVQQAASLCPVRHCSSDCLQ